MNDDNDTKLEAEYIPRHAKIYQVPDYIEKKVLTVSRIKKLGLLKGAKEEDLKNGYGKDY